MLILTSISIVVAIIAVAIARSERGHVAAANLKAEDANRIAKEARDAARVANKIADEGNGIARQAVHLAQAVPAEVAWDELLIAVHAIQSFSPATSDDDVGPFLTAVRTRASLLVDRLDWKDFDKWVAAEVRFGVSLMHEAFERGHAARPLSVDDIMEINASYYTWVAAFSSNLRRFRKVGPEHDALIELTKVARAHTKRVSERNGWPEPVDSIPGVATLQDVQDGSQTGECETSRRSH